MKATKDTPHHKKCRELMKKNYYEKDGKTKSALKYYKRKFRGIGEPMKIIENENLDDAEKLNQLKLYNLKQKITAIEAFHYAEPCV